MAACELADKAGPEQGVGKEKEGATERLLREIQGLGKGAGGGGGAVSSEGLYQVYLGGGGARPSIELAAVEARVAALERALGPESVGERRALSAATDGRSLQYAADNLTAKRSYFQQQHLDHVEGRLAALSQKMTVIGEQKAALVAARQEDKLARLSRLVEGQASLAGVLPDLLQRFEEVEEVGGRAAAWPGVLDSVEQGQQGSKRTLEETRKAAGETREELEGAMAAVGSKFAELQKQLETIKV